MEGVRVTGESSVLPSAVFGLDRSLFKAAPFYVQGAFQYESTAEARGM